MQLNLDSAIFIGFLAVNLVVGLYYGRNVKTIKDYALGGRNFSTVALVATTVATWASGSGFFITLSKTYSNGLYYVIASSGMALQLVVYGVFLIPRMKEFLGKTSIAEAMGDLYGKNVRIIVAITGIIGAVGSIAVQYKAFGNIFNYFLGFPGNWAVIIAGCIVTIYSAFGGIRAVTFTDVLQFFTFGIAIPLISIIIWNHLYSTDNFNFANILNTPKFDYTQVININNFEFWQMIPLLLYFIIPGMEPAFSQRIIIGKNITQVKKAFIISAVLLLVTKLLIAWIPILVFSDNPNLQANQLLSYIVDNYTYTGLKGLIIIGVTALAMSTADSYINISSVLFAHDLCRPLKISSNKELFLSRIFAIFLGIFAIILALSTDDLLTIILTANSFYMPVVTIPLIFTILGFRSSTLSVLIAMGAGFTTVVIWKLLSIEFDCIVIAMLVNLLFLMGSHYLLKQPGGWVGIRDTTYLDHARKEKKRKIAVFFSSIKNFNFIEFCKKNSPKNELTYTWLGIYCILYSFTTMYATHVELLKDDSKIILITYQIMMVTGVVMAMYPIWPERIKSEIIVQIAWNIVIFYMLIFFSCFFVMVSNFGKLQLVVFALNILIAAILVGWKLGFSMAIIGFYLSIQFYKYYTGLSQVNIGVGSPQFIFIYALMFVGTVLVIFFKPKQEHQILTEEKNKYLSNRISFQEQEIQKALAIKGEFIRNISHEYHAPMTGIYSMTESLIAGYHRFDDKTRMNALKTILDSALRLEVFDSNISSLSKLSQAGYKLNLEKVDLSSTVYDRTEMVRRAYEENHDDRELIFDVEEGIIINADKFYLGQAIDNLIINAITYCKKGRIVVSLKKYSTGIEFSISDEGIGIPPNELYDIFAEFTVSSKTKTLAGGRGVGLTLAKRVVEVHGGTIKAESNGTKGAKLSFVLPNKLT